MKQPDFLRLRGFLVPLFFAIALGCDILEAQVTVAPSMLFIDARNGIGNLYITNNTASPQEVSIGFAFGYPNADSAGNATMNYNDTLAAKIYSLNPMVHAFPRSFILGANQQQTVRLQVRGSNTAKDAFYFTRVKITSNAKSADIGRRQTDSVATQISFKFDQILPVFYRKGDLSTGLVIHSVSTTLKDNKLIALADVERTGSAPFIGSVKAELFSPTNESVALFEATATVYFRMKEKFELDLSKAGKGPHRLVMTFETKRSDVSSDDLFHAQPVTKEVTVNIP